MFIKPTNNAVFFKNERALYFCVQPYDETIDLHIAQKTFQTCLFPSALLCSHFVGKRFHCLTTLIKLKLPFN